MATLIRMPEVMTGATEAVIASWIAQEGATVAVGDVLAEVETDKALVELAAESAGTLLRRLAADGERVEVGAPIAVLGEAGEAVDLDALLGSAAALASESQASADDDAAVGAAADAAEVAEDARAQPGAGAPTGADGAAASGAEGTETSGTDGGRLFASPIARKMARDSGVDLSSLRGSGPGGRIVRRDVEAAITAGVTAPSTDAPSSAAAPAPAAAAAPAGATTSAPAAGTSAAPVAGSQVPHTSMRRAIARRLTESKVTVPHFYVAAEPRADALLELRRRINDGGDVRVSVNDLVVKAVAAAYRAVLERARAGRLKQSELEGGSITVSNLGMYGTPEFAAIINPPQSAILAVGAAVQQPVVIDGELAVGSVMRCVLSADHRAVDGALAAQWAAAFTRAVEAPLTILV